MTSRTLLHRFRVRYVECDMQGIVFNAHYYTWMDVAHTELWRDALGTPGAFDESGLDFVVAESSARYRAPARFDEEIDVEVGLEALSTTSMTTTYTFRTGERLLVEGRVRHVCIDRAGWTKSPWPDRVRDGFAPYL